MSAILTNNQKPNLSQLFAASATNRRAAKRSQFPKFQLDPLGKIRQRLDAIEIRDRQFAEFLYKTIPGQCPFERDIQLFGRKVAHIPPLCKLNPLYDQLVGLRFRALCYLVDRCGVDINPS